MKALWSFILDFIFPPSSEALALRSLSPSLIFSSLPVSPPPPYPFITSLFAYKDPLVRELVWSIKYKKDRHAVDCGAYALYEKLKEIQAQKITLVPIPISKERRRERGYNQCELLVDGIIRLDKEGRFEKRYDILVRSKHIDRQTLKGRKERLESTENIFKVEKFLDGKVVIIDDVVTTGSTTKSAYEALFEAGYHDVIVYTLSH